MSKFDSCLTSLNLRDSVPVDALRTTAAEYEAEGMSASDAMLRAVEDQLELAQMEEATIIATVRSKYEAAGGKKKPAQKAKAEAAKAAEPKPGAVDNTPAPIPESEAVKPEAKPASKPAAEQDDTLRASVAHGKDRSVTAEQENAYAKAIAEGRKREALRIMHKAVGIEDVDASFDRDGAHTPAGPQYGSPLYDVSLNGTYPEDIYSSNGRRYYGTGEDRMDAEAYRIIQNLEAHPNRPITVYRAVEKDGAKKILPGDWVTTVRDYAKDHGEGHISGEYKIIKATVYARDIFTAGDSWLEWGYHPQDFKPEIPKGEAKSTPLQSRVDSFMARGKVDVEESSPHPLRANVGRTIEVDGVRRPITNSKGKLVAQDFAKQQAFWKWFGSSSVVDEMGRPLVSFHGTDADFAKTKGTFWTSNTPEFASLFTEGLYSEGGQNVRPVYLSINKPLDMRGIGVKDFIKKPELAAHLGVTVADIDAALGSVEWSNTNPIKAFHLFTGRDFIGVFKRMGYDGVHWQETIEIPETGKSETSETWAAFNPGQVKSAVGNAGTFKSSSTDITAATSTATSPMDSTVAELVKGGVKVEALLERIENESSNPDFRALAGALRAQNLKTKVLFERAKGTYTAGVDSAMATAAYKASTDTAYLHQVEGAEQNILHELVHASSLKALAKGGLAAQQIKSLWRHVKALPNFAGEYGITNEEEFIAEAYTSPRFRQMLADTPAPGSKLSFWDKLVGIVKMLLGKPPVADSVLARVMAAGPELMAENNVEAVMDERLAASGGELSAAFKRWFGKSKVVDENGKPMVVYHGTHQSFNSFDPKKIGSALSSDDRGFFFTNDASQASAYATEPGGNVIPAYVSLQKPLVIDDAFLRSEGMAQIGKNEDVVSFWDNYQSLIHEWMDERRSDGVILVDNINLANGAPTKMIVALRPGQIKSAIANNGKFDASNSDLRASITAGTLAQQISSGIDAATLRDIPRVLGNRLKDFRGIGLAALGRRQLVDIYAPDFAPEAKESLLSRYSALMQQMDADKNEAGAEADGIADRWGKLKDGTQLADLMHDSTLAQIDPAKDHIAGDNRADWTRLNGRFKALSPDAQKLYTDARDAYDKHWQKVRAEIRGRIERATPDSPRRAALLEKMDATFYEKVKGVYFPLARFGDYVVTVQGTDGARLSVNFAETMNEADALRKELMKKYPSADGYVVSKVTKKKEFNAGRDTVSRGFMQELFGVLDQYESGGALQDDINQLYLASMPDLSWAKHGIHRKGTPGFSQDARRAFAQNMFHGARYLAKLRYGDRLADYLTEMQDHLDSKATDAAYDSVKAQQVVDEMTKRHESYMNPNGSALSSTLTSLGFIFYLGLSPASAAVNLSQTPLVTLPMLAAKYGFGKASAALLEASKQAAGNRNDISKALSGDELKAYQDAVAAGVIDVSMAHDLAGIASGDDTRAHAKLRPVMKWASWMFHHGEKFNRQASLIAAYRLARGAGKTHDAAYAAAVEDVYASHFDYSASNRPRVMQGNVAKVILLFKQYAQNMIYTLSRNAVLAAKGDKVALKTLAGLLVSHALAAGVLGLPIVGTLLAVATALGSDDDEPWDAKVALRNQLADLIGQKPAEVLMHGVSRLGPWDVSGRVGLDKLILPDVQEGLEGARAAEAWMTAALGPVAGIGMSTMKGLNNIAEGNVLRGLEDMLPVSVRNPLKALRFATEGVQDKTGIPIVEDTSALEELGQAIGFSPSRSREANEGKGAVYRAERKLNDRRAALVAQWAHARMAGDAEGAAEIRLEIANFNEKQPGRRITQVHLTSSLRQRNKRIAQAEDGVYLPKKHQDVRELGRFAEQD